MWEKLKQNVKWAHKRNEMSGGLYALQGEHWTTKTNSFSPDVCCQKKRQNFLLTPGPPPPSMSLWPKCFYSKVFSFQDCWIKHDPPTLLMCFYTVCNVKAHLKLPFWEVTIAACHKINMLWPQGSHLQLIWTYVLYVNHPLFLVCVCMKWILKIKDA